MAWFKKKRDTISRRVKVPEGLWVKCNSCKEIIYKREIDKNLKVCPKCRQISEKQLLQETRQ
jgi:acetyl-CoA carboxylase carboxyl transferase subunit beta